MWNGTTWNSLGTGSTAGTVLALEFSGSTLYVGGSFSSIRGLSALNFAVWNGTAWSSFGSAPLNEVWSIFRDGTTIYIGGESYTGSTFKGIASWNGSNWNTVGTGIEGIVYSIIDDIGLTFGQLFVSGSFTTSGMAPRLIMYR
jgi:hypothetical protein